MATEQETLEELIDDAWELIAGGELQKARERHQEACRREPSHREVVLLEIELLKAEGQGEEAVAACEEARDRHPNDMLVDYTLATLLLDIYDDVMGARPLLESVKRALTRVTNRTSASPSPSGSRKRQQASTSISCSRSPIVAVRIKIPGVR